MTTETLTKLEKRLLRQGAWPRTGERKAFFHNQAVERTDKLSGLIDFYQDKTRPIIASLNAGDLDRCDSAFSELVIREHALIQYWYIESHTQPAR